MKAEQNEVAAYDILSLMCNITGY